MPAAKKTKRQTRHIKQEVIDDALTLLQEDPSPDAANSNSSLTAPLPLPPTAKAGSSTAVPRPVKKELDSEEQKLLEDRWEVYKVALWDIWATLPAIPSLKSRCEWAKAHGVPPVKVHRWFDGRKAQRKKKGIGSHPETGYELRVEQPDETSSTPLDDGQELRIPVGNALASSSPPPSSPPRTPVRLDSPIEVKLVEPSPVISTPFLQPAAPLSGIKTIPRLVLLPLPASPEPKQVQSEKLTIKIPRTSASNGAKRGQKRKAAAEGGDPASLESTDVKTKPARKKKRVKVEKVKAEPVMEPVINAPSVVEDNASKPPQEEGGVIFPMDLEAYTSDTVPPHSLAAKAYTSILTAPFVLEEALTQNFDLPDSFSMHSFAPVKESLLNNPSPYTTRPLPPLPQFETLDDPVAFERDCKDALRISLEINSELKLWDPVVESLPPSYFMDLGKNLDMEWPEIDWP
ncbi:hypothetical protein FRC07_000273 [Ceratobasidium sp. 392]|nr:hypothetical protein FRC07_000273 [Ceratobasidium sp. 392]